MQLKCYFLPWGQSHNLHIAGAFFCVRRIPAGLFAALSWSGGPCARRAGLRDGLPCHFVPDSSCERGEIRHICGGRKVPMHNYRVCCSSSPDAKVDGIGPSRLPAVLQPRLSGLLSVPEFDCSKLDSFVLGSRLGGFRAVPLGLGTLWTRFEAYPDVLRDKLMRRLGSRDGSLTPGMGPWSSAACSLRAQRGPFGDWRRSKVIRDGERCRLPGDGNLSPLAS